MIFEINYPNSFIKAKVLIDEKDWIKISKHGWCLRESQGGYYPVCTINNQHIKLANFVLNISNDLMVDHINGNTLDNQAENLRQANRIQNGANKRLHSNNVTGYKGVSWNKRDSCYQVKIGYYGKRIHVINSKDLIIAAKAYDKKAKELFGEFARLNFPEE